MTRLQPLLDDLEDNVPEQGAEEGGVRAVQVCWQQPVSGRGLPCSMCGKSQGSTNATAATYRPASHIDRLSMSAAVQEGLGNDDNIHTRTAGVA